MLKVMVVDDEAVVRRGLRNTICWGEYGFELVGEADDGISALELSSQLKPDIIITDICMPIMDGLAYLKQLRERDEHAKIIVLSGHDRFDFARDAIQYGVFSYLLKPIGNQELIRQLLCLKEEIEKEKRITVEFDRLRVLVQENRLMLKERLLVDLVRGNADGIPDIRQKLDFFDVKNLEGSLFVLVGDIDNYPIPFEGLDEEEMQIRKFALVKLAGQKTEAFGNGYAFQGNDRQFTILFSMGNQKSESIQYKTIFSLCEEIKSSIREQLGFTVTIGVSRAVHGIGSLKKAFLEAEEAVSQKSWIGKYSIIYAQDFQRTAVRDCIYPAAEETAILAGIKSSSREPALEAVHAFFDRLQETRGSGMYLQHVQQTALRLVYCIDRALMDSGTELQMIPDSGTLPAKAVLQYQTADDVRTYVHDLVDRIILYFSNENKMKYRQEIAQAVAYINEHFNEPMDLNSVAEHIHISQYYLSRLFKKETGSSFTDYLNSVRIDRAKDLMKQGTLKLYEIAEKVGYHDNAYFGQMFKKFVGCPPGDFRRKE